MTRFTDSPYEYMMSQKPGAGHVQSGKPSRSPVPERCITCPYGRGRPCASVCMKNLLSVTGRRKQEEKGIETDK